MAEIERFRDFAAMLWRAEVISTAQYKNICRDLKFADGLPAGEFADGLKSLHPDASSEQRGPQGDS